MKIDDLILSYKDEMISTLQDLVRIKSVYSEPQPGKPFGEGVYEALQYALNTAKRFGIDVKDVDAYAGHAQYGPEGDPLGILVHLDVVPEGSGWSRPPFEPVILDGFIYGRGTSDDKGPAVASLFALRAIKEAGAPLKRPVRLIFGCNEETQWKCIEYYSKHEKMPTEGFSPDASYPVINREKGFLTLALTAESKSPSSNGISVDSISGGMRANVVPASCRCVLNVPEDKLAVLQQKLEAFAYKDPFSLTLEKQSDGKVAINAVGKAAHGSHPEMGKNAIAGILLFLKYVDIELMPSLIRFLAENIGLDYSGAGLGIGFKDDLSGPLTLNLGIIEYSKDVCKALLDIRYPITSSLDNILNAVRGKTEPMGITVEVLDHKKPHYVPDDTPLVGKLLKAYEDVTGQKGYTLAMGGATYARAMERGVAFGAVFPGHPDVAHQADEYISIDSLIKSSMIYAHAILELCGN